MVCDTRWLMDGSGTLWLAWKRAAACTVAAFVDGSLSPESRWDAITTGWDLTVDNDGALWVTWVEEGSKGLVIFAQRYTDGVWGRELQVSTTGSSTYPVITPDEYGNVWIFWERKTEGSDIVMCRMGPRSGQETLVARNASRPRSAATRQGVLYVTYGEHDLYTVTGTEHGGFGEPMQV